MSSKVNKMSSITTNNIYNGDSWVYVDIDQGPSLIINLIFRKIEMKIIFYICDMTSGTKITCITIIVLLSISPPHVQTEIDHDQISGMHTTMPTWSEMYMTNVEIWSCSVILLEIWETLKTHREYYPRVIDLSHAHCHLGRRPMHWAVSCLARLSVSLAFSSSTVRFRATPPLHSLGRFATIRLIYVT